MLQTISRARAEDQAAVHALLAAAHLPTDDLAAPHAVEFWISRAADGRLEGVVGLEPLDESTGLLRSLAVDEAARGGGVGRELVGQLEAEARERGFAAVYLLTTDAAGYFPRLGYAPVDRAAVPDAVRRHAQFTTLCPSTAVCMVKRLG